MSTYSFTWSTGNLDIQSAPAALTDATTARTDGHYDKLAIDFTRLQSVSGPFALYAGLQGQWASKNLDISEKLGLGGSEGVRAYPEGEAYVDEGYVLNLEGRLALQRLSAAAHGQVLLVGFVDTGTGRTNRSTWDIGPNDRTLTGGGGGLNYFAGSRFALKAYYAHKIGRCRRNLGTRPGRSFLGQCRNLLLTSRAALLPRPPVFATSIACHEPHLLFDPE